MSRLWLHTSLCFVVLALCVVRGPSNAVAATLEFALRFGSGASDLANAVARDPSGAFYVVGAFGGNTDFDPGPGTQMVGTAGNIDAFVAKYDAAGAFQWARRIGGTLTEIGTDVVADAGGVYVSGTFEGSIDLDPGAGVVTATSQGGTDVFIVRLDSGGNYVWGRTLGGTVSDSVTGLATDGSALYLTGTFRGTVDLDPGAGTQLAASQNGTTDTFVLKLGLDGAFAWARVINGSVEDVSASISADSSGAYITGAFNGVADFDPGPGTTSLTAAAGSFNLFILKLDGSGNFAWVRSLTGPSGVNASAIKVDGAAVYVTGTFADTVDFDPGAGTTTATSVAGSSDVYVLKLDTTGGFVWVRTFGGNGTDGALDLTVSAGAVYVAGYFSNSVDFDPGAGTQTLNSNGAFDAFVTQLTAAGAFVTAYKLGGTQSDIGTSLVVDGTDVVLVGFFDGTGDFDPGSGTTNLTSAGLSDVFLSRVSVAQDPPVAVDDAYSTSIGQALVVPSRGVLTNDTVAGQSASVLQSVLVANPTKGSVSLQSDGSFTYTPNAGVIGSDQFTYRATYAGTQSAPATVSITIAPSQCGPRPRAQVSTVAEAGRLRVTVTASALGTGGANQIQQLRFLAGRSNAIVTVNGTDLPATGQVTTNIGAPTVTFYVARQTAGQSTTVPFVVVDTCGDWQTFVGGGPNAF